MHGVINFCDICRFGNLLNVRYYLYWRDYWPEAFSFEFFGFVTCEIIINIEEAKMIFYKGLTFYFFQNPKEAGK